MSSVHFTSGCWYESVSFSTDCPEKPLLKSLLFPALVKPAIATGSRHLPAPLAVVGGISLTRSLPSLLQAPRRGLSHALPSISGPKAFTVTSWRREVRPDPDPDYCWGLQEKDPPWQRPSGLRVQSRFIHSAPCVSAPTNPVDAPAAPHTLCLLPPPASLSLALPLPRST